jgi:hypothetical protein
LHLSAIERKLKKLWFTLANVLQSPQRLSRIPDHAVIAAVKRCATQKQGQVKVVLAGRGRPALHSVLVFAFFLSFGLSSFALSTN